MTDTEQTKESSHQSTQPDNIFFPNWEKNIDYDESAPQLYSKRAVYTFGFLFTVLFGGVLFIYNLRAIKNTKPIRIIWAYVISYLAFSVLVVTVFIHTPSLILLLNILGAVPFYSYFWKKYIGSETKFRKKSLTEPLIVSLVIIAVFVVVYIM